MENSGGCVSAVWPDLYSLCNKWAMKGIAKLPEATLRRIKGVNWWMAKQSSTVVTIEQHSQFNIYLAKGGKYMVWKHWHSVCL